MKSNSSQSPKVTVEQLRLNTVGISGQDYSSETLANVDLRSFVWR